MIRNPRLSEIASVLNCPFPDGTGDLEIMGISSPDLADSHTITFVADPAFRDRAAACAAPAVIVRKGTPIPGKINLEVDDPYVGYARAARLFEEDAPLFGKGLHPTAWVAASADLDPSASVGPQSVIGARCRIGAGTVIGACCVVENGSSIGHDCRIDSGAVIRRGCVVGNGVIIESGAVIGSEGFANARDKEQWERIPSFGNVVIEDEVWIGANTCVDRGSFGSTRVGRGTRLDNLIHLAHNVTVGEHSAMAAQVGISGSTRIGRRVIVGGQAGFVGHIEIGDDAFVGAQAGVSKGVAAGGRITGTPARDFMRMRRIEAAQGELPQLLKEVKRLRAELDSLRARIDKQEAGRPHSE